MNTPWEKTLLALQLLLEGNSIRSTERIAGLDKNTQFPLADLLRQCVYSRIGKWWIARAVCTRPSAKDRHKSSSGRCCPH